MELTLRQPVPLPFAVDTPRPIPSVADVASLRTSAIPEPGPAETPSAAILSLPQSDQTVAEESIVPRVNQIAGETFEAGSEMTRPPAQIAGRDVPAPDAAGATGTGDSPVRVEPPEGEVPPDAGLTRIEFPPDARPRVVVFGESYRMPGRVVGTVYLKTGLAKDWSLEYWASAGGTAALSAPWPFLILRPDLALPAHLSVLLVRASLTTEGRLEQPAFLTANEWPWRKTLFDALVQWRFRPATANGKPVAVEILLVIPRRQE